MPTDWDDETKVSAKDELERPSAQDRDRAYLIVLAGSSVGEMYKITAEKTVIGRGQQADIQVIDEGISRRHAEISHEDGHIIIRDLGSTNGTYCNGDRVAAHQLSDGDKIQVGSTTILKFTFHDSLDESFQRQMYESALRDGLTKIFNKKYFMDRLESEFAFAVRHRTPLSLIMFDIDYFKRINDSHGHLAGDYALSTMAAVVQETIRQEDVFARYGGEEFVVICRGIDLTGATAFGERIRRCVDQQQFVYTGTQIRVTVSVGVAAVNNMREPQELIGAADDALYQAKRQGRNRVISAGTPSPPIPR
ncbi:MAG TPA: GGDEF domain-containing protein [Polyangia bacterium]|nr:GGDEF domain-containing protein [Polyangia bacterium]